MTHPIYGEPIKEYGTPAFPVYFEHNVHIVGSRLLVYATAEKKVHFTVEEISCGSMVARIEGITRQPSRLKTTYDPAVLYQPTTPVTTAEDALALAAVMIVASRTLALRSRGRTPEVEA